MTIVEQSKPPVGSNLDFLQRPIDRRPIEPRRVEAAAAPFQQALLVADHELVQMAVSPAKRVRRRES
jgi:hypothetical protein